MKKVLGFGALALVGLFIIGATIALVAPQPAYAAYGRPADTPRGSASAAPVSQTPLLNTLPAGDLSADEIEALTTALDDEYKAWATYDQIIADFGAVRPFTNIQKAEASHIAALETLFDRYGLDVPENEWEGNVASFDTLAEACQAGVDAEIANADLYDQLLSKEVDNADIVQVFTNLQQASLTKHLPAFERCAP
jgi:hypothetical protein